MGVWRLIKKMVCSDYIRWMEFYRDCCEDLEAKYSSMVGKYANLCRQHKILMDKYNKLLNKYNALLEAIFGSDVNPPEWLDTRFIGYTPLREILRPDGKIDTVAIDPKDLYVPTPTLVDIVLNNGWLQMEYHRKLKEIWSFVILNLSYQYDRYEDWRYPVVTLNYGKGDCEDCSILFVTLCRIAGIPASKVFNACGYYYTSRGEKIGHSFPIVQHDDGKWYVYETTLNVVPEKPVRLLGSPYSIDFGAHNWKFSGKVRDKYRQEDGKVQF